VIDRLPDHSSDERDISPAEFEQMLDAELRELFELIDAPITPGPAITRAR
jgi:hypothetical protein